jgi:hypothetical protein
LTGQTMQLHRYLSTAYPQEPGLRRRNAGRLGEKSRRPSLRRVAFLLQI